MNTRIHEFDSIGGVKVAIDLNMLAKVSDAGKGQCLMWVLPDRHPVQVWHSYEGLLALWKETE